MTAPSHVEVLEELADSLKSTSDSAYVAYIEKMRTEDCLGVVAKIESGKITEGTIAAFLEAGRLLGLHQARSNAATELRAAIALMRAPVGEVSEADELRARLHKLADYWIGITRDQDIAYKDRPLLEMYDKGLTKCANELRHKLRTTGGGE